jgi:Trk K+ transport system NAD-binding subunit
MGRVGTGVYDAMEERLPGQVIGVDYDEAKIPEHRKLGRNVVSGNASTPDFWDRVRIENNIEYVMLAIPEHKAQLDAIALINKHGFKGKIAAHARYPDELEKLKEIGVDAAFNIYAEAGSGFANHAAEAFQLDKATAGSSN